MALLTTALRHTSTGAVEAARGHAADVVASGSDRVRDSLDRGVHTVGRLAPDIPGLPTARRAPRRGRRMLLVVALVTVVGVVALVVARRRGGTDETRSDEGPTGEAPTTGAASGDGPATAGRRTA